MSYIPYDRKCESLVVNGPRRGLRCRSNKEVGHNHCRYHMFNPVLELPSKDSQCEAIVRGGKRKGEKCGVRTKRGYSFCYRHIKATLRIVNNEQSNRRKI